MSGLPLRPPGLPHTTALSQVQPAAPAQDKHKAHDTPGQSGQYGSAMFRSGLARTPTRSAPARLPRARGAPRAGVRQDPDDQDESDRCSAGGATPRQAQAQAGPFDQGAEGQPAKDNRNHREAQTAQKRTALSAQMAPPSSTRTAAANAAAPRTAATQLQTIAAAGNPGQRGPWLAFAQEALRLVDVPTARGSHRQALLQALGDALNRIAPSALTRGDLQQVRVDLMQAAAQVTRATPSSAAARQLNCLLPLMLLHLGRPRTPGQHAVAVARLQVLARRPSA
jgi:type III secretion regulatory protein HpaA